MLLFYLPRQTLFLVSKTLSCTGNAMRKFTRSKLVQSDDRYKVWEYRGLRLVCDRNEVYPDDPGNGTPAIVQYKSQKLKASSTYWCATGEGCLEITSPRNLGSFKLSDNQLAWLDSLDSELTEFLYK